MFSVLSIPEAHTCSGLRIALHSLSLFDLLESVIATLDVCRSRRVWGVVTVASFKHSSGRDVCLALSSLELAIAVRADRQDLMEMAPLREVRTEEDI